jgi:hypothetical protein
MPETSQIKTSDGQRNDQPQIADDAEQNADAGNGVAGRVPVPSITQRQTIMLAGVAVVLVAVYLYTRSSDDNEGGITASAYDERDSGEGFQEAAEESPDDLDLDELEQASETGVEADRQVVNWMRDRGRLASED